MKDINEGFPPGSTPHANYYHCLSDSDLGDETSCFEPRYKIQATISFQGFPKLQPLKTRHSSHFLMVPFANKRLTSFSGGSFPEILPVQVSRLAIKLQEESTENSKSETKNQFQDTVRARPLRQRKFPDVMTSAGRLEDTAER